MRPYNAKIDHFSMIVPSNCLTNREVFDKIGLYKLAQEIGRTAYEALPESDRVGVARVRYKLSPESFEAITMIRQRYLFGKEESLVKVSVDVLNQALREAGWEPESLDFIIFSSVSAGPPNTQKIPTVGCRIQEAVGAWNAWAYDMMAACSGWVYPIQQATAFIHSGMAKRGAVVVSEMSEAGVDYFNEKSSPLIGDVATATLMSWSDEPGVWDVVCKANSPKTPSDIITLGYPPKMKLEGVDQWLPVVDATTKPKYVEVSEPFALKGKTVFAEGIREMTKHTVQNLEVAKEVSGRTPDWFVYHQANGAMLMKIIGDLGIDPVRNLYNIDRFGNTIGATIPSVMAENWSDKVKPGDLVSAVAFGGGVTSGRLLFKKF